MSTATLLPLVEAAAEALVLADLSDPGGRRELSAVLAPIAESAQTRPVVRAAARVAMQLLAQDSSAEIDSLTSRELVLEDCVRLMQEAVRGQEEAEPAASVPAIDAEDALAAFALPAGESPPPPMPDSGDLDALLAAFDLTDHAPPDGPPPPAPSAEEALADIRRCLGQTRPDDLPALARIHDRFEAVARSPTLPPSMASAVTMATGLVESLILQGSGHAATDLQALHQAVDGLLDRLRHAPPGRMEGGKETAAAGLPVASAPDEFDFGDMTDLYADADKGLLRDFVGESLEHLEAADHHLLDLEQRPGDRDLLDAIFRAFHTIKGVAGFLGLLQIQRLSHEAENLLDALRKGEQVACPSVVDVVLKSVDALKTIIASGTYPPGSAGLRELILLIRAARTRQPGGFAVAPFLTASEIPADAAGARVRDTLKVDTERLDQLVDLTGELVIATAQAWQTSRQAEAAVAEPCHQQAQIATMARELHRIGMSLRMVPIRPTFRKMARVVHDLAHKQSKQIRFVTAGEDTELDRAVVDRIGDPLLHMVRNAADHGIEGDPQVRIALGKPAEGTIELRACHQGGCVVIEVRDDGRGLDRDAILEKAVSLNLLPAGRSPSDRELYMLIFEPGFSTRKVANEISGRGVGMDIVKRSIDGLRGRIEVVTERGKGTSFVIRLPLTLAVIDGALVRVGSERYVIPAMSILRTVTQPRRAGDAAPGQEEFYRDGDRPVPVFRLALLFGVGNEETAGQGDEAVVLLESEGRRCAVIVDELLGQEQIVLKGLGHTMEGIGGFAGAAILPDGRVSLIVDAAGLLQRGPAVTGHRPLVFSV